MFVLAKQDWQVRYQFIYVPIKFAMYMLEAISMKFCNFYFCKSRLQNCAFWLYIELLNI